MAPVPKTKTLRHFTHPEHDLVKISTKKDYVCAGCKTPGGAGIRFRCHNCDFNMHEYCATCPATLSSFIHPHHNLTLVFRTQGARQNERVCDLCADSVEGLFYRCKTCDFDIHPLCTQLPQYVRHALHPAHQLLLQPSACGWCAVCRSACSSWRYRCAACSFDIHLECMLVAPSNGASTSRAVPPAGPPPQFYGAAAPPYPHGYGVYPGFSPQYNYNHVSQAQGSGQPSKGKKVGKIMYALVGKLTVGVLANVLFGLGDFSFFS